MNTLVPIFLVVLAATVSAHYAAHPKKVALDSRVNRLTQLANLLKDGVHATTVSRPSSVRPLHIFKELPRTPEEERIENLERTYARRMETYLGNQEDETEALTKKTTAAPQTTLKSQDWNRKVLSTKGMDQGALYRNAVAYNDNADQYIDDIEEYGDEYLEDEDDVEQFEYDPVYLSDIDRYQDVTQYFAEQQDEEELPYDDDEYLEDDDEEEQQYSPIRYSTYDQEIGEDQEDLYLPAYPQPRYAYQESYSPAPVPAYRAAAVPERPRSYAGYPKPAYTPRSSYPTAKNMQATSYVNAQYQPAPEQLPITYSNQYQKHYSNIDEYYEPDEYKKLLEQAKYSETQTPYVQTYYGEDQVRYEEPVIEYVAANTTAAPEPAKPEQAANATMVDNGSYVKVPLLPDTDVMVVIQATKSSDNTTQVTEPTPSYAQDQSDSKPDPVQQAVQNEILVPVAGAESIMTNYVESKPAEVVEKPAETVAKLSANRKRQQLKSPLRRKVTTSKKQATRPSLAEVVRNYLKSKRN